MIIRWNTDGSTVIVMNASERDKGIKTVEFLLELCKDEFDTSEALAVLDAIKGDGVVLH